MNHFNVIYIYTEDSIHSESNRIKQNHRILMFFIMITLFFKQKDENFIILKLIWINVKDKIWWSFWTWILIRILKLINLNDDFHQPNDKINNWFLVQWINCFLIWIYIYDTSCLYNIYGQLFLRIMMETRDNRIITMKILKKTKKLYHDYYLTSLSSWWWKWK